MTVLDWVTIGALAGCAIYGAGKGLIWELSHLGALFCGLVVASCLQDAVAELFFYRLSDPLRYIVAYVVVFLASATSIYIVGYYVKKVVDSVGLKVADHVAGALFGIVQGGVIVSVTVFVLVYYTGTVSYEYVTESKVSAFVINRTSILAGLLPDGFTAKVTKFVAKESAEGAGMMGNFTQKLISEKMKDSLSPNLIGLPDVER